MRWPWRRRWVCSSCGALLPVSVKACGQLKRERQVFPDGGWVQWDSFTACSDERPGGRVVGLGYTLPDAGDLDDVRGIDGEALAETGEVVR